VTTPMLEQYKQIKKKAADAILFFRLGDFYEMFRPDAEIAAPILDIVLTARDAGNGTKIPMCGVPYHSAENYVQKLVSAGYKVAICVQVEDPRTSKGIVKREIVRVITPGTLDFLGNETKNNYLASIYKEKEWGLAYTDISTGHFQIIQTPSVETIQSELNRIAPSELLLPQDNIYSYSLFSEYYTSIIDKNWYSQTKILKERFSEHLELLNRMPVATKAATGLWCYIKNNIPNSDQNHILKISSVQNNTIMVLDKWTRKNLELVETLRNNDEKGSLFSILNQTKTAFGARLLRNWIQQPLIDKKLIEERLNTVEELTKHTFLRKDLQKILSKIYDLERILSRISLGRGNARDLFALATTLSYLPKIRSIIIENNSRAYINI